MSKIVFINGIGTAKSESTNFDFLSKELDVDNVTLSWQRVSNNENSTIGDFATTKHNVIRRTITYFASNFIADAIHYFYFRFKILDAIDKQIPDDCTTIVAHSLGTIIAWDYIMFRATKKYDLVLLSSVVPFYWRGKHKRVANLGRVLSLYSKMDLIAHKMKLGGVVDKRISFFGLWVHSSYLKSKRIAEIIREFIDK